MSTAVDRPHLPAGGPERETVPERLAGEAVGDFVARYAWVFLVVLGGIVLACSVQASRQKPLWYDEVFTYWVAAQPDLHRFAQAMPAEGNPPLNTLLARLSLRVFGASQTALRLPPMLGFLAALFGAWVFVRRESDGFYGLLAVLMVVSEPVWSYSFEARPYGVMMGCLMLAMVSWQAAARSLDREPHASRWLALSGMGVGIVATIFSHHIGLLEAGIPLAFGEGYRTYKRRSFDRPLLAVAGLSLVAFAFVVPMARRTKQVVINEPSWTRDSLAGYVRNGIHGFQLSWRLIFDVRVLAVLVASVLLTWNLRGFRGVDRDGERGSSLGYSMAAAAGAALLVPLTWIAMLGAKGYFFCRYGIGSTLGVAMVASLLLARRSSQGRRLVAVFLAFVLLLWADRDVRNELAAPGTSPSVQYRALYEDSSGLPIVVADPLLMPQVWWYAPPGVRERLTYLSGIRKETVLESALMAERPVISARLMDAASFLRTERHFLLYEAEGEDSARARLAVLGCQARELAPGLEPQLYEVRCGG